MMANHYPLSSGISRSSRRYYNRRCHHLATVFYLLSSQRNNYMARKTKITTSKEKGASTSAQSLTF